MVTLMDHRMRIHKAVPQARPEHFHTQTFKIILCWKQLSPSRSSCIGKDCRLRSPLGLWYTQGISSASGRVNLSKPPGPLKIMFKAIVLLAAVSTSVYAGAPPKPSPKG